MTSGISPSALEIRQEKTSRFCLRVEWTSAFNGFLKSLVQSVKRTIFFTAVIAVIVKYMKNDLDITKFESAQKTTVELLSRFELRDKHISGIINPADG